MNRHIFRHEFLIRLRSVITWSLSLALLIILFYSFSPVFIDEAALMNQVLANFPPQMKAVFGLNNMDLATALGFFSFIFLFVQLCLAIQAGNYGFGLVSIEETELTADFLLTRPVSRTQILTSKLLAALASLALTNAVIWISTFIAIALFQPGREFEMRNLLLLLATILPFQLFFLSVGLIVSLLVRRVRSVTPYALGLGFGMYVLNALNGIFDEVAIEWITPFKHFDAAAITTTGSYDTRLVALNLAVSLLALVLSYWRYNQRDVHAVS